LSKNPVKILPITIGMKAIHNLDYLEEFSKNVFKELNKISYNLRFWHESKLTTAD
jgi:hypothetical protein